MGGDFGGEWILVYVWLSPFPVCLKWSQHCSSVPCGSDGKASACNEGDPGSIPGWGRSPGEGNGKPLQYSCLEKPMDLVGNSPWSRKESDTTERLHFIVVVESLSHVWLFSDPMDCSSQGSFVHGISQARILECEAISFSRGSSRNRGQTRASWVSCVGRWVLYCWVTREALI